MIGRREADLCALMYSARRPSMLIDNDRRKIFSVCNNLLDANLSATTTGRAHAHPQLVHALGQAFAYRADLLRTGDTLESVAA